MNTQLNTPGRPKLHRKRGSALVVSMMFVILVAGMGVAMVQLHTSQTKHQEQMIDNKRAIYMAEAGLAESYMALTKGMSGNIGTPEEPASFGDGLYWVEATDVDASRVSLVSTGMIGKGRFAVAAVLQRQMDPIASLGFFSGSDISVGSGAIIDGYDSTLGTYRSQIDGTLPGYTTGKGARLAAMGDVLLDGPADPVGRGAVVGAPTVIYGDAQPGPQGAISLGSGVSVTGSTAPLGTETLLPAVEVPFVTSRGDITVSNSGAVLDVGKYGFGTVRMKAGVSATIRGPALVVFDQLILEDGASMTLDATKGRITLYVKDRLYVPPGASLINPEEDAQSLALMIAASAWVDFNLDGIAQPPVEFSPAGEFYGYIYAPEVDFEIGSGTHFIGGLAANSVTVASGAQVSFDLALATADQVIAGLPRLIAWRICDIPDRPITRNNTTPTRYLQEQGRTPVESRDASLDRYMTIKYYDLSGTATSFSGLSSGFDWSNVNEVSGIVWDDDPVIGDEGQRERVPVTWSSKIADGRSGL